MRKSFTLLFVTFLLAGCFKNNTTSASDSDNSNDASSSSSVNSSSVFNPNDFGEGYTIATTYTYDEATGLLNMGTVTCNYHPDSKTFTWGENNKPLFSNKIKIVGDSLWIGPLERIVSEDAGGQTFYDKYFNIDTLALSNNHNGIWGIWTVTKCTRVIGKTEINCTPEDEEPIEENKTLKFTSDSVYITKSLTNSSTTTEILYSSYSMLQELGFNFDPTESFALEKHGIIKFSSDEYFHKSFSIGDQSFERNNSVRYDPTGLNSSVTFSSNGKTCSNNIKAAFITKELCQESNEDFLLSERDKSSDQMYYEEGPVGFYMINSIDEYNDCVKGLASEETRNLLNQKFSID